MFQPHAKACKILRTQVYFFFLIRSPPVNHYFHLHLVKETRLRICIREIGLP